jgi:hypothetical protein
MSIDLTISVDESITGELTMGQTHKRSVSESGSQLRDWKNRIDDVQIKLSRKRPFRNSST